MESPESEWVYLGTEGGIPWGLDGKTCRVPPLSPPPHTFPLVFPDLSTPRGGRSIFLTSRGQHLLKPLQLWPDSFPHGPSRSRRAFILSTPPQSSQDKALSYSQDCPHVWKTPKILLIQRVKFYLKNGYTVRPGAVWPGRGCKLARFL